MRFHQTNQGIEMINLNLGSSDKPWNKGKLTGQKPPLKLKEIWAIRMRLQIAKRHRDLALFNLAIDSKLRRTKASLTLSKNQESASRADFAGAYQDGKHGQIPGYRGGRCSRNGGTGRNLARNHPETPAGAFRGSPKLPLANSLRETKNGQFQTPSFRR